MSLPVSILPSVFLTVISLDLTVVDVDVLLHLVTVIHIEDTPPLRSSVSFPLISSFIYISLVQVLERF